MQNSTEKRLERMRRRIVTALRTAKHAQASIAEMSFMNADTLEVIERELTAALRDVRVLASH